jgi:predicted Zn-dependent protease
MAIVGRNQPCPCGSGNKYKHCCLSRDEAAAIATREQQRHDASPTPAHAPRTGWRPVVDDDSERLDKMSNDAVDLIHAGKLNEAEPLCHRLLEDFPDLPDGHMRLGQLLRVRGEPKKAAEHLRLAAAVARSADDDPALPLSLETEADSLDPPIS